MNGYRQYNKKRAFILYGIIVGIAIILIGRLAYLMIFQSKIYEEKADALHKRERAIKAPRGKILDRNGVELAGNKSVCTVSVIYNQEKESERDTIIRTLAQDLELDENRVRKLVEKKSVREKIKSNVEKTVADKIRSYGFSGVVVDEDYKRFYPYEDLASKVLGFTGADNQGIVGLEVQYENILAGKSGYIMTTTDVHGIRIEHTAEEREEALEGNTLVTSLDYNIQCYAQQAAEKVMKEKQAKAVSLIVCNPQNGEIYACVNVPEYNLQKPFELNQDMDTSVLTENEKQDRINQMWRNPVVSDTYEPGSTFKIVTATAALEKGVVNVSDQFFCPGYKIVEDRRIRCHKIAGHGPETFREGVMNSCNPVFMEVGARVGAKSMIDTYKQLGLYEKTGIDLSGEANSIMHPLKEIGAVELATMSFGQSFQITPFQLLRAVGAVVNGGNLVTPHFATAYIDAKTKKRTEISYAVKSNAIKKETSETMKSLLKDVVALGSGKNAKVAGYSIGGKTATSEKLPRGTGKYISSFLGFAPAEKPVVMALIMIHEPQGVYYGGTIAAPVIGNLFESVLPYLGVKQTEPIEEEQTQSTMVITD